MERFQQEVNEVDGQFCVLVTDTVNKTYSFDGGETWHDTQVTAYSSAVKSGLLKTTTQQEIGGQDLHAFVLALLHELQGLNPGEHLRIIREQDALLVTKNHAVLGVRASTLADLDLRLNIEEERHV